MPLLPPAAFTRSPSKCRESIPPSTCFARIAIREHRRERRCRTGDASIAELADTVARRVHSPNVDAKLARLHDVLFDIIGFVGNVDGSLQSANSYLPDVRTHRGLPFSRADLQVSPNASVWTSGINRRAIS